jgi:hypothetical protein
MSQGGLLSFVTPEKKCKKCWQVGRLSTHCHLLGFFSIVSSLTTSPPNASLGFLWSHWLHHHLMHLLGFCDLIGCITTLCISWVFIISPRFHWLHHHLMHLLGFCDLTNCITTWCISWVFVILLTTSPPNASLKFLWYHWLHHHLMYLLICGDVSIP